MNTILDYVDRMLNQFPESFFVKDDNGKERPVFNSTEFLSLICERRDFCLDVFFKGKPSQLIDDRAQSFDTCDEPIGISFPKDEQLKSISSDKKEIITQGLYFDGKVMYYDGCELLAFFVFFY